MDSLSANKSLAAFEQNEWQKRRENDEDPIAHKVAELYMWCVHHQACLAKKPALLGIPSLCSSLVRQCHTFRSSTFRQDFYNAVHAFLRSVQRVEVLSLPNDGDWLERNKQLLGMCSEDLSQEDTEAILQMFNNDWTRSEVKHYCLPGCCSAHRIFREKMKKAAILAWGVFPDVPLMYRWKGFEEACCYTMRGIAMHRCLPKLYKQVYDKKNAKSYEEVLSWEQQEFDGAEELSPAAKQQLRMVKTIDMLHRPNLFAELCQALMIARPLAGYMNQASALEACRQRIVLLGKGLRLPTWNGPRTETEIKKMSFHVISGAEGMNTLKQYTDILTASANTPVWCPWLNECGKLDFQKCFISLVACAAETWRRLVFRFECWPYEIFHLASCLFLDFSFSPFTQAAVVHDNVVWSLPSRCYKMYIDWTLHFYSTISSSVGYRTCHVGFGSALGL